MVPVDEGEFVQQADATLAALLDALEEHLGDQAEIDMQDGILTIELEDGRCYVINKHGPNRQIWMSSPVSGAHHFASAENGGWVDTRGERELHDVLEGELASATGAPVRLR